MTNKEASERIQKHRDMINNTFPNSLMAIENTEALNIAIKALEQQDRERWIPVSEKPPSDDDMILYSGHYLSEEEVDSCSGEWFLDRKEYMTAWKPMPEPYKEENDIEV